MKKYIKEYLSSMAKRGLRSTTIDNTRRSLGYFYDFLKESKITKIDREVFRKYRHYLIDEKPYKHMTIKSRILPVRRYFQYLTERKCYLFNPAEDLSMPKRPESLPQDIPSTTEIQKILDSVETVTRVGKRRKAILEILYSTGIRARELLNLEIYDVDFKTKKIMIRSGKGNKDRVVPFGRVASAALKDYIENARKYHAEMTGETKLFLSTWGKKLRYPMLIYVMGGARKGKRLKAHSVRHACAIGMMQNGADIRYIQELLGHKNVSTTQIYTQILPQYLKEAHRQYHPRALVKNKRP